MPALPQSIGVPGAVSAAEPLPEDAQRVLAVLVDVDPQRAHGCDGRLRVGRAAEARHQRLPVAERADEHGAVGDGLVARDGEVAEQLRSRLDDDRATR